MFSAGAARGLLPVTLVTVALAGCSSDPGPVQPAPGTLAVGTAQITVNDHDLGKFQTVRCVPAGSALTIAVGNANSGTTAVVSSGDALTAQSVTIRDLGGFTGSYNEGLGGSAKVTMTGRTYSITGTAAGFDTDKPGSPSTGTFAIKAAC